MSPRECRGPRGSGVGRAKGGLSWAQCKEVGGGPSGACTLFPAVRTATGVCPASWLGTSKIQGHLWTRCVWGMQTGADRDTSPIQQHPCLLRGNVKGQRPYQEGTPCSQCPSDYRCHDSLCGELGMGWEGGREGREGMPPGLQSGARPRRSPAGRDLQTSPHPTPVPKPFVFLAQPLWRPVISIEEISTLQEGEWRKVPGLGGVGVAKWKSPGGRGGLVGVARGTQWAGPVRNRNPSGENMQERAQKGRWMEGQSQEITLITGEGHIRWRGCMCLCAFVAPSVSSP